MPRSLSYSFFLRHCCGWKSWEALHESKFWEGLSFSVLRYNDLELELGSLGFLVDWMSDSCSLRWRIAIAY